jgi:hypothetical protein
MAVDDESERDLAQLPQRARPTSTRTDARSLPREVTAVTRPLFTADESADDESAALHDDDDEGDLFDAPQATTADTPALSDATEFNVKRPQLTAVSNHDSDDDDSDDDNSAAVERTVVSLVLPDHLRDQHHDDSDDNDDEGDEYDFDAGGPTQFTIEPHRSVDDEPAPPRDVTQSHYVYATTAPAARPAWQLVAMAVGVVVVLAVVVVVVAAFAVTPAPAPSPAP